MTDYEKLKYTDKNSIVYVIQDVPGSKIGAPKINIIGATQFGQLKVLLPENSQIILSPNYVNSRLCYLPYVTGILRLSIHTQYYYYFNL